MCGDTGPSGRPPFLQAASERASGDAGLRGRHHVSAETPAPASAPPSFDDPAVLTDSPVDEKLIPKTTFWPYDVFGYLLPVLALAAGAVAANRHVGAALLVWVYPGDELDLVALVAAVGIAYVVGHVVAAAASYTLERFVLVRLLRYPTVRLFPGLPASSPSAHVEEPGWVSKARELGRRLRSRLRWTAWPARFLVPGYYRPYSEAFRERVLAHYEALFGFRPVDVHDLFWVTWEYVAVHHPPGYRRAAHFLELYGFARNVSMALLLLALLPLAPGWTDVAPEVWWSGAMVVGAALMFSSYAKLLRRMNDEVFRAFVATAARSGDA